MRAFYILLLFFYVSLCSLGAAEPLRVLFIGNSYTYCNNLPDIVQAMADNKKYPMEVDSYTLGAASLRSLLNSPQHAQAARKLAEGNYDWVILQDQSQTPANNPSDTLDSVQRWSQLAAASKTRVMLFLTWAHADTKNGKTCLQTAMQDDTSHTYCRAAIANNATVAPVGESWRRWYKKHPDKPLHTGDMSHPTPAGSYLAACVIYSTLTKTAADKLPPRIMPSQLRLTTAQARELQKTAAATLRTFTPQGYLDAYTQKDATLPTPEAVIATLHRGMSIKELAELLGPPTSIHKTEGQHIYQYRIRSKAEFVAYCTAKGAIRSVSIMTPGAGVRIIDLNTL